MLPLRGLFYFPKKLTLQKVHTLNTASSDCTNSSSNSPPAKQSLIDKVPLLFNLPANKSALSNLYIPCILLIIGSIFYFFSSIFGSKIYFMGFSALLIVHAFLAVISSNSNLIFLFRYFLVWLLIFATAIAWAIWDGDVKAAPFGAAYQTLDVTCTLIFAGFLSLNGSLFGWLAGIHSLRADSLPSYQLPCRYISRLWKLGAAFALLFSISYYLISGGIATADSTYVSSGKAIDVKFSVFNVFQFFGISLLILAAAGYQHLRKKFIWLAISTLVIGMLVGSRADYMPQALLLLTVVYSKPLLNRFRKLTLIKVVRLAFYGLALLSSAYYISGFIAAWRFSGDVYSSLAFPFSSDYTGLLIHSYEYPVLWLETGSMAIGTLYAAIVNVETGLTPLLWGSSYFDWILKIPPQFIGLPRPQGLEWAASIGDQIMSQGGIFEVSEAYWNFGLVGCFVISFLISYSISYLLRKGLRNSNLFMLSWYLVMGLMSLRGIWYQNFTYFRISSIMIFVYIMSKVVAPWFLRSRLSKVTCSF